MLSTSEKDVAGTTRVRHPSPKRMQFVHGVSQMAAVGAVFAMGGDAKEIGIANAAAMNALTYNHGHSVGKLKGAYLGAKGSEPEEGDIDESIGVSHTGDKEVQAAGDLGYESDTSKSLRKRRDLYERDFDQAKAQGGRPSLMQNKRLFDARIAYDKRQENKARMKGHAELLYKTPGAIKQAAVNLYDFATNNPAEAAWLAGENVPGIGAFMTGGRTAKEWHAGDTAWYMAAGETALGFSGVIGKGVKATVGVIKNSVKFGRSGLTLAKTTDRTVHALDLAQSKIPNAGKTSFKINGNSRSYVGETHVYVIRDAEGNIYKVGESMQGVNKLGQSKRAELQRRKLERTTGQKHETEIREMFPNKDAARTRETGTIKKYREYFGDDKLPGNKGNR